jgi:two-component system, NarL family, nitrate/nitrite response regulator NarL
LTSASIVEKTAEKAAFRILVADDQEALRKRVCATLSRARFEICAEAGNGMEAVEMAKRQQPDAIVLDITMPVMNGLDAARLIRQNLPSTPILILSVYKSRQLAEEARKIGVSGYVAKSDAGRDLVRALQSVLESKTFFPSDL